MSFYFLFITNIQGFLSEEVIVGCYDSYVYVLCSRSGSILYKFKTGDQIKSSPCVDPVTGYVWCCSYDHYMYPLILLLTSQMELSVLTLRKILC